MDRLSQAVTHKAIKDAEKLYSHPQEVLDDSRLDDEEKCKILDNWLMDQKALIRADSENMAEQPDVPPEQHTDPAALIPEIEKAKQKLQGK